MQQSDDPWSLRPEDFPASGTPEEKLRFLVRYAVLAPSFRNTQPWRFEVGDGRIGLYADLSRRQRAADLSQRDLYVSLGCALENLILAAAHFGFAQEIVYFPLCEEDELVAQIRIPAQDPGAARHEPLLDAITRRRTPHGAYASRPVDPAALGELRACCREPGLTLLLTQDESIRQAVEKFLSRADAIAFGNAEYLKEQEAASVAGGFDARGQQNTPAFGLIGADKGGRDLQVKAGRVLERLYLTASTLGLSVQPMSVLLEFDEVTAAFARLFRAGGVPLLPFRLGYAEQPARPTPRRPLEDVVR